MVAVSTLLPVGVNPSSGIKYHQVSFKGSHNSYDRNEPIHEQILFHPEDASKCGCRGLEFDIWRHSDDKENFFSVSHINPWGGKPLAYYLGLLLSYHLHDPQHDVIHVTIDIKSSNGSVDTFPGEIDSYLTEYFNRGLIFTPGLLFHEPALSLCENVIKYGWPEINSMRGKFVFCLSGTQEWKEYYAGSNLPSRLCFSDKDVDDDNHNPSIPDNGNFVFFNMGISNDNHNIWKTTLPEFAVKNLMTRTYVLNDSSIWNNALNAGVSILATDEISNHLWAKVTNLPFTVRKGIHK